MITQTYDLNMIPDKQPVIVKTSQYDKEQRTIVFNLYEGSIIYNVPSGSTVSVRGTKPDKTGYEYECTYENNVVQFEIQEQQTVCSGYVPSEIRIAKSGTILGSCNFLIFVEPAALGDDTEISETELPLLEQAVQAAIEAREAIAITQQNAQEAATSASNAATSESNAATSETNAAASEANAQTYATNAATSATNAAASESNAATSETNAAASESNAATSETNAATSATNAANSASAAAQSETAAANSASAAAQSAITADVARVLEIQTQAFSSLPLTVSDNRITQYHVVVNWFLSDFNVQQDAWIINTYDGYLTITGGISGSTTMTMFLLEKQHNS